MDLFRIIETLYEEKKRIDRAIAALEELTGDRPAGALPAGLDVPPKKKRGRPRKVSTASAE
ncbi:MAG: hypothetical protein IT162_13480 [Bryobacterales bacterium]|nr:hypothetical protein [Bryobacterales bacterium]